jgi:hypothetical protein
MRIVFIAGPYSAISKDLLSLNILQARKAAETLWAAEIAVLCPHLNSSLMEEIAVYSVFVKGYLVMLKALHPDAMLMLPGWELSDGATAERMAAEYYQIPIFYSVEQVLLWASEDLIQEVVV